ncbi:tetratricopeptide repeat protein 14-like isoform X2 [Dysidea avara]|uniref:tetratricopeptide repeat protein 14-like isoform X2 n=1 Tax=Dysidea avara TaxID=196820 RepID=UPI0033263BEF
MAGTSSSKDGSNQEDNVAPMWYPPHYYAAAASNMPPMYYPTSQWGYSYAGWTQQPPQLSTAVTSDKKDDRNIGTTLRDASDGSRETLEHAREQLGSIDDIDDSDDDKTSPSSHKPSDVQPPLSALKTEYSSSSTSSSSNSSPHNHGNSPVSNTSLTQQQYNSIDFEKKLKKFTTIKASMIRNIRSAPLNLPSLSNDEDCFACMEPLEYYTQTLSSLRRERFFELIAPDDIILGHVDYKKSYGVYVQIDSFEGGDKHRYISDLDIQGFISIKNLASTVDDRDCLMNDLQPGDVLRAQVIQVIPDEEKVFLTIQSDSTHLKLGYLEGIAPPKPSRPAKEDDFDYFMASDPGLSNPHCIDNLVEKLGVQRTQLPSLVSELHHAKYPEGDYYNLLKKRQRKKWSMENVATGVKHFKAGEHEKAMKYLDHALEIDGENVEGLVARGALVANKGQYKKAIGDFVKALTINNNHSNAKKYLAETQEAYGKQLEERGDIQAAMHCYREALADDPDLESPKRRLHYLEAQVAAVKRKEEEEKQRKKAKLAAKLRKLMEDESKSRRKLSDKKHKKKRRKEGKKRKKHATHETESSSSSQSDAE